jgi:hypothetical protein
MAAGVRETCGDTEVPRGRLEKILRHFYVHKTLYTCRTMCTYPMMYPTLLPI